MTLVSGEVSKHHNGTYTSEKIFDGDGAETSFSGRLDNFPIVFGTVTVSYTVGSTTYQVTDSNGVFTGTHITSGSIDEDGNWAFVFSTAPDDATEGTADSYDCLGLLGKILDICSVKATKESLGTGNGVQVTFSKTLAGSGPIEAGNVRLIFVIGGVTYDLWDNGQGEFEHPLIYSSSVNYTTRAVTVTFEEPIDNNESVNSWHQPESEKWIQVLEARDITNTSGTTESNPDNQKEVILYNSGVSRKEEIIIGLREYSYVSTGIFGIELALGSRWTSQDDQDSYFWDGTDNRVFYNASYNGTYRAMTNSQKMPCANDVMKYWINYSKSRIIAVVRNTGTVYTNFYVGEGIRFCSQAKYEKPQLVAGNTRSFLAFSNTGLYSVSHPESYTWRFFDKDKNYREFIKGTNNAYMTTYNFFDVDNRILKRTTTDKVFVQRIYLAYLGTQNIRQDTAYTLFALDGIFFCPDNEIESEHTLNTTEYLVFQNIYRVNYYDYFCIEQS